MFCRATAPVWRLARSCAQVSRSTAPDAGQTPATVARRPRAPRSLSIHACAPGPRAIGLPDPPQSVNGTLGYVASLLRGTSPPALSATASPEPLQSEYATV